VDPAGNVKRVTEGFERYVGEEGRYGIIVEARIALPLLPGGMRTFLVSGGGVESFTAAAAAVGTSGVLPLLAEAMVMGSAPPDFERVARNTLDEPGRFRRSSAPFSGRGDGW